MHELFTGVVTKAQDKGELKAGAPLLLMGLVMGAFVGVIRSCVDGEEGPTRSRRLAEADWKFAEQCVWEAVRS
jgi:hypothetical protein